MMVSVLVSTDATLLITCPQLVPTHVRRVTVCPYREKYSARQSKHATRRQAGQVQGVIIEGTEGLRNGAQPPASSTAAPRTAQ